MITTIPLMIVALIAYNGLLFGIGPANLDWSAAVFSVSMISGAVWTMTLGDVMIALALFLLFFEILKATRFSTLSIVDHLLSTLVLIAFIVEFLLVSGAATSVFFLLMMITLVDVLAGFSVSIRTASRDVSLGGNSL